MSKTKERKRWEGPIGIGDRLAFVMPGEHFVTAGTVVDITGAEYDMLCMGRVACMDCSSAKRQGKA